jgi:hypothetical protein
MGCNVGCMRKARKVFASNNREILAKRIANNARLMLVILDFLDFKALGRISCVNM